MKKPALILAHGDAPKKSTVERLVGESGLFVCADGGANTAAKLKLTPDAIVGDMDSIHPQTMAKFHRVPMHRIEDENSTDLEKAIAWVIEQRYDRITVIGATGKRLDHTVGNLGVLSKFHPDAAVKFVDDDGELVYVGRQLTFEAPLRSIVSLIPLTRCDGIRTRGLEYALENESLQLGIREGTSNVVIANPVTIKVARGTLLLYRIFSPHR